MTKIYTRKGDDGSTSLWYGGRRSKSDTRIEAYGAIDEAGSALGVARAACSPGDSVADELRPDLLRIQNELFVLGAELATAPEASDRLTDGVSRVTAPMVADLEADIDRYMNRVELPPKFVIPGGNPLSGALDLARAILRRAERRIGELNTSEGPLSADLLAYVNRAADLVYAMARFADVDDPELFEGRAAGADSSGAGTADEPTPDQS